MSRPSPKASVLLASFNLGQEALFERRWVGVIFKTKRGMLGDKRMLNKLLEALCQTT
jgi:hypothetical protein